MQITLRITVVGMPYEDEVYGVLQHKLHEIDEVTLVEFVEMNEDEDVNDA